MCSLGIIGGKELKIENREGRQNSQSSHMEVLSSDASQVFSVFIPYESGIDFEVLSQKLEVY